MRAVIMADGHAICRDVDFHSENPPYGHAFQLLITLSKSARPTIPSPEMSLEQYEQSSQELPSDQDPPISSAAVLDNFVLPFISENHFGAFFV